MCQYQSNPETECISSCFDAAVALSQVNTWKVTVRGEAKPVQKKPITPKSIQQLTVTAGMPLCYMIIVLFFQPQPLTVTHVQASCVSIYVCKCVFEKKRKREGELCLGNTQFYYQKLGFPQFVNDRKTGVAKLFFFYV